MTTATGAAASAAPAEHVLRGLELTVFRRLDGVLHGEYQGLLPGLGSESGDGRPYVPGDDVRRIDWNLTARTNELHVRTTTIDHELDTWIVLDGSASLDFGTARCEKRDLALVAGAAFGFVTGRGGNRLGAVVFDGHGVEILPPRAGRATLLALLHRLEQRPRDGGTSSLAGALRHLERTSVRRGLVVVVSDLLDDDDWASELRAVSARHEVVVCHVTDGRDVELPAVGLLTLVDPETGRLLEVQTASRKTRERFAAAATMQRATATNAVRAARAGYLQLDTDRDWLMDVVTYVSSRRRTR
jgi:uncharacterized protein (DUF58 family)